MTEAERDEVTVKAGAEIAALRRDFEVLRESVFRLMAHLGCPRVCGAHFLTGGFPGTASTCVLDAGHGGQHNGRHMDAFGREGR
jgi:hypothetical protein